MEYKLGKINHIQFLRTSISHYNITEKLVEKKFSVNKQIKFVFFVLNEFLDFSQ